MPLLLVLLLRMLLHAGSGSAGSHTGKGRSLYRGGRSLIPRGPLPCPPPRGMDHPRPPRRVTRRGSKSKGGRSRGGGSGSFGGSSGFRGVASISSADHPHHDLEASKHQMYDDIEAARPPSQESSRSVPSISSDAASAPSSPFNTPRDRELGPAGAAGEFAGGSVSMQQAAAASGSGGVAAAPPKVRSAQSTRAQSRCCGTGRGGEQSGKGGGRGGDAAGAAAAEDPAAGAAVRPGRRRRQRHALGHRPDYRPDATDGGRSCAPLGPVSDRASPTPNPRPCVCTRVR
eukprot:COSAG01_NODE_3802_length_5684_cov_2.050313_2_plen_287_part_00